VDYLHTLSRDGGRCRQKDELDQVSRQCLREFPIADCESKEKLKAIIDGRLMTKVANSVIQLKCEKLNVKLMKHSDIEVQDNPEELKILNSVQSNSPEFQKAYLHFQSAIADHQEVGQEYQQTALNG
jgi:hypothetical protein